MFGTDRAEEQFAAKGQGWVSSIRTSR